MTIYEKELLYLIQMKALIQGDFTLSSGEKTNFFFDMKKVFHDPHGKYICQRVLIDRLGERINQRYDPAYLTGVPRGGTYLANMLYDCFPNKVMPLVFDKYLPSGYGQNLILFEDVITTGASTIKIMDNINDRGYKVDHVFAMVDRCDGGFQAIRDKGPTLDYVFTKYDILEI